MQAQRISLDKTNSFSSFFLDYIHQKESLAPYYQAFPTISAFEKCIEDRDFPDQHRAVLTEVLQEQYSTLEVSKAVTHNIQSLQDGKTFTITTGHQLNIFTGPLYFIYKIITVVNTCTALKQAYPEYHFVPVYWMASEDHDFEEINHFYFEGHKLTWDTNQAGAVGHFDPSGLLDIAKKLPQGANFFTKAYQQPTLAEAVRYYVNHLFEDQGVVVVDADHRRLKKLFAPVMEVDLFHHTTQEKVNATSQELEKLGYSTQVHARPINFFYLDRGIRERIEKKGEDFQVLNSDLTFTKDEVQHLIQEHPERFSPNVILRPLYQETILPNLAYVGGPSEVVYWLQLKEAFGHFHTFFPLLMPRNFGLILSPSAEKKWKKTELHTEDLFLTADDALKKWVRANSKHTLTYAEEIQALEELESQLKAKSKPIDPTLAQHIEAIHATFKGKLKKAEKKLLRAEKKKHEERKNQIDSVRQELFPGGTLQERKDNFLNFYAQNPQLLETLITIFDPFDYQMYVLHN